MRTLHEWMVRRIGTLTRPSKRPRLEQELRSHLDLAGGDRRVVGCWLHAWRASRLDPNTALRAD